MYPKSSKKKLKKNNSEKNRNSGSISITVSSNTGIDSIEKNTAFSQKSNLTKENDQFNFPKETKHGCENISDKRIQLKKENLFNKNSQSKD